MQGPIDILRRFRRPSTDPTEYYQRPHVYDLTVGVTRVCVSLNRQHLPAITLLVQADLSNLGVINIGDTNVTVNNGIQLDSGKAVLFSPQMNPMNQPGQIGTGIDSAFESVPYPGASNAPQAMGLTLGATVPVRVVLAVEDFFAVATIGDQHLRVFWVDSVRLPSR